MYTCELCNRRQPAGTPQEKLVVQVRNKPRGGQEIVKELRVCPPCFETHQRTKPVVIKPETLTEEGSHDSTHA